MVKFLLFTALTLFVLLARYPTHDVYGQSPIPLEKSPLKAIPLPLRWGSTGARGC